MSAVRFGLIADTQYADRPCSIGRYYRNALRKTGKCMEIFRREGVDFIVHLGDIIDCPEQPREGCEAMDAVLNVMRGADIPLYFVLGNHDLASVPYEVLCGRLGLKSGYYSFDLGGVHFIVLDSNFDVNGERYRPENSRWDQCHVSPGELLWLAEDLKTAQAGPAVVFVHALLDDLVDPHVIRNAFQVRPVLENCGREVTVFQGHKHSGYESETNGIRYHTLKAVVNGRARYSCLIAEAGPEGVSVKEFDSSGEIKKKRNVPLP